MPDQTLNLKSSSLALLANGSSGNRDTEAQINEIRARLEPKLASFRVYPLSKGMDIAGVARQAVADGADIVAVLGGDGTQSGVAGALAGGKAVMAVLPSGTFNYFARSLGLGNTLGPALDALEAGHTGPIDLGEVNGRIFLNNASFGVYPAILEKRESIYRRWGRSRMMAYWSVLVTLADMRHPMRLQVTTGDQTRNFTTPLAFAARSPYQLESFGLEGADAVREGHFALFLARNHGRRQLITAAMRLALGRAIRGQDFEMVVADDIVISGQSKAGQSLRRLLAFDGEKAKMAGPWHLRVRPNHLRVILPAPGQAASETGLLRPYGGRMDA